MYTRATIISTVFLAKLWDASIVDFTRTFLKEIDSIIYKFLWRTTEWIAIEMYLLTLGFMEDWVLPT
jgi:hypothetical protein